MADLKRTIYPYNWSLVRCRWRAQKGKFTGQRPTFYHCATPVNFWTFWCKLHDFVVDDCKNCGAL